MSDDPVIIDGTTGEVISGITERAKRAKPTFVGGTEKKSGVVRTKVIRRYRGLVQPPITNRNFRGPTAEQMSAMLDQQAKVAAIKVGRALGKGFKKGEPPIVTLGQLLISELLKKMEGK
jgi:hypothetical protein